MKSIKVKEVMTSEPFIIAPTEMVNITAKQMKKIDCGILPVGDTDKVIGILTDRHQRQEGNRYR